MTRIAIVIGSVRTNRVAPTVAQWVLDRALEAGIEGVELEVVDLASFNLPIFSEPIPPAMAAPSDPAGAAWNEAVSSYDGLIFVTPEYNWTIPGALKNAIDFLTPASLAHKGVGIVAYSSGGGLRAADSLRYTLANFEAAVVRQVLSLNMMTDFENFSVFKPAEFHNGEVATLVEAVARRSEALAPLR